MNPSASVYRPACRTVAAALLMAQAWASVPAWAGSEDVLQRMKARVALVVKAKESGKVGEKPDGLLGVVKGSDEGIQRLVDEENADRKAVYSERAGEQGQDLEVFMRVMGDTRIDQEKSGRFIQKTDGSWLKK